MVRREIHYGRRGLKSAWNGRERLQITACNYRSILRQRKWPGRHLGLLLCRMTASRRGGGSEAVVHLLCDFGELPQMLIIAAELDSNPAILDCLCSKHDAFLGQHESEFGQRRLA